MFLPYLAKNRYGFFNFTIGSALRIYLHSAVCTEKYQLILTRFFICLNGFFSAYTFPKGFTCYSVVILLNHLMAVLFARYHNLKECAYYAHPPLAISYRGGITLRFISSLVQGANKPNYPKGCISDMIFKKKHGYVTILFSSCQIKKGREGCKCT